MSNKLKRYKLGEKIGVGAMGEVFQAYDTQTERTVAIKMLSPYFVQGHRLQRFQLEARTVAHLEHPFVVPLYDFNMSDGETPPFLVMRYMPGGTLADRIRQGKLTVEEIYQIIRRIASALDAAHERGLVHRDVKPGNILLDQNGYAYLTDFGIVKDIGSEESFTRGGQPGTALYMSPEQILGDDIDHRSDIYSLGVVAFEMLTGRPPFLGNLNTIFQGHLNSETPSVYSFRDGLPDAVDGILRKAMSKEPNSRNSSASQMAKEFGVALRLPFADLNAQSQRLDTKKDRNLPLEKPEISQESFYQPLQGTSHTQENQYYKEHVNAYESSRNYLTSKFVPVTLRVDQAFSTGPQIQSKIEEKKYYSLKHVWADFPNQAIIIMGQPGSGKTTLLRRFQYQLSYEALEVPDRSSKTIPFFVSLNVYDDTTSIRSWLTDGWERRYPQMPPFEQLLAQGRFIFLLDGLNEIFQLDKSEYRRMAGEWRIFLQHIYGRGNSAIFSCRNLDYQASLSSETIPVIQVQIEPLATIQIASVLDSFVNKEHNYLQKYFASDPKHLDLFSNPFYLHLLVEQADEFGTLPRSKAALLTGFVRRALYREIVEKTHFRFESSELLSEDDVQQVLFYRWADPFALPQDAIIITYLEKLAYHLQSRNGGQGSSGIHITEKSAKAVFGHENASEIIAAAVQLNVLHKDLATRTISFAHHLFQEYFAGRIMAREPELQRAQIGWRVHSEKVDDSSEILLPAIEEIVSDLASYEPIPRLPTTGWEETILLAAEMSSNPDEFVMGVMPYHLVLAAKCASLSEVLVAPETKAYLQQALISRLEHLGTDIRFRIAVAEALSELGDLRFKKLEGAFGAYLLPPLVEVPGGQYKIGDNESENEKEKPEYSVELDIFEMGAFPVTNAEYACFIESGGYQDERWWQTQSALAWLRGESSTNAQKYQLKDWWQRLQKMSIEMVESRPNHSQERIEFLLKLKQKSREELEQFLIETVPKGKRYTAPEYWTDERFNHPSQPVVGITLFEAKAYCAWLSAQTGKLFVLPTEQEWEAAARGFEGRKYAYGPQFDSNCCNSFESHLRRTTPVGIYPNGKSPEGIYDLCGNVWEWTSSVQNPYPNEKIGGQDFEAGEVPPVARGGSWFFDQSYATVTNRGFDQFHAGYRLTGTGFRLLCRK